MFTKPNIKAATGVLRTRLLFILAIGALLALLSSSMTLARSIDSSLDPGTNNPTGALADSTVYLPVMMKNFPTVPDAPVLSAISNEDGDGNYTISWSSSEGADTYTLEEDVSTDFSSPTPVYSGPATSTAVSGRDVGTYYYRVRASNAYASSDWSNVESVEVTVPPPECPQTGAWITSPGGWLGISFDIETAAQCQIAAGSLKIKFRDSCSNDKTAVFNTSVPITNNHFTAGDARIQVTGDFTSSNTASGTFSYSEGLCSASSTWTAEFNPGANGDVNALALQSDGKIVVGGEFTRLRGQPRDGIGRLNPDGSLDTDFNPGATGGFLVNGVLALAVQADDKILVGGDFTTLGGQMRNYIGRLNPDGSLDTTFDPGANDWVWTLVVQADGKILVGGDFRYLGGETRHGIGRLNPDGTLDATFNPGADGNRVFALAVQADGKILVGGEFNTLDGQTRNYIGRLNPDGSLDTTFDPGANDWVRTLVVQADGKILVGGYFRYLGGEARNSIGRLNPDGTLDATFDPGTDNGIVYALAVQADGKIVVGGFFTMLGGQPRNYIGRLNANGTIDVSFNPGASFVASALAVQEDGKIVVGGDFVYLGGETHRYIGRLNPDGTIDTTFP